MTDHQDATLGTQLRLLLELLDGDVERHYSERGLRYRPRYTPVVRTLIALGPSSIKTIARHTSMSHSAVSQTVAKMVADALIVTDEGRDGRQRIARPAKMLMEMIPELEAQWFATNRAAACLENELSAPLSQILSEAIDALHRLPFRDRIAAQEDEEGRCSRG